MIPRIDATALLNETHPDHADAMQTVQRAAHEIGFMVLYNTPITATDMKEVIKVYKAFFTLSTAAKTPVDMAKTGASRGWGAAGSEQVDPDANPDYKQVFDCGYEWPESGLAVYAPNIWPDTPADFRTTLEAYYRAACAFSLDLLSALTGAIGQDRGYFRTRFDRPMALLRGNYYPPRPDGAGPRDFGIATHTDYGCLTLLATDGTPGLEVRKRGGGWVPLSAPPGEFIINFGEMLQMWTDGQVLATPHRVIGGDEERISVPLFFNPNHDTNVAPIGSGETTLAGDHLTKRYAETYVHLQKG